MKKNLFLIATLTNFYIADAVQASCVSHEFISGYCYIGLTSHLSDAAISITPRQFGYEAETIVDIKVLETVQLAVTCENGPLPVQTFVRIRKKDQEVISKERYKAEDAIADVKAEYQRLYARISNSLCPNELN